MLFGVLTRIFVESVERFYEERGARRGFSGAVKSGAVTVVQRTSGDNRATDLIQSPVRCIEPFMARKGFVLCFVVVAATLSCGKSEEDASESGKGGSAVASNAAGSGGSGNTSSGGSGTGDAGSSSQGDPDPILCGGAYPSECADGKLCLFDSGCGTVGHCVRKPEGCDGNYAPVCGCDGTTYSNDCEARTAGVTPNGGGECGSLFDCGPYRCDPGSYCVDKADDADGPWRYACIALPSTCNGVASCDCVADVGGCFTGFTCMPSGGSITLTCE
ncbi:hypothetical protein predicted by Glimmer/Critica [Sorangium cellulosum So ce56]|uniref:Kazal-like domain-containing protein n=1 Tax=Sorangium cellulosum (strain So ce56) TaxID=448385 RepID=A9FVT7_SORC5|nr:hypothetical protein predicted by Glimmer/Critica [Sorangium cellulosum So ce56]